MKQRRFFFPLERRDSFGTFEPAANAVWADRWTAFCADMLQYYHGSAGTRNASPRKAGWSSVPLRSAGLKSCLPRSSQAMTASQT
jgi:hypothetical protein